MKVGIGQDSHRFLSESTEKKCVIGGCLFDDVPGMDADSDGDVILHAICNAITSISGVPILGGCAIHMCRNEGITDSVEYVKKALETLDRHSIQHVALSIEGKKPRMQSRCGEVRASVASILGIDTRQVGLTMTSGDELTDFGRGLGIQCLCILTVS